MRADNLWRVVWPAVIMMPWKVGNSCLTFFSIVLLAFSALVGSSLATGSHPASPRAALTGLGSIKLGLNGGPGTAQTFSLSKGVQYYRIEIGSSNSTILAVNEQARTKGVDYLGVLSGTTLGVARSGTPYHMKCSANCNWTLSDWKAAVKLALEDYPNVHSWEIWNEAYSSTQRSGYFTNVSTYLTIVKAAYAIIKSFDANDTVVCLGGSGVGISSAMTFTQQFWNLGATSYCDAISLHGYVSGSTLFNTSSYERMEWPKNLRQFENVTGKPIWITEFGRQSAEANTKVSYSQQNQNDFIMQAMGIFENLSFVKRAYVYTLAGLSNPPDNTDFGLLNATTLKPKLAWGTFLNLYSHSLSHLKVPTVNESAPSLRIAHLSITKLLTDKINATAPWTVDPIKLYVDGSMKIKGIGSVAYPFVGTSLKKYNVTAYDAYTGLATTKWITVV